MHHNILALIFALILTFLAGYLFQTSYFWGVFIAVFALVVTYLNLPVLLILKKSTLIRRLPRLAMLYWLGVFNLFNLPRATLIYINNGVTGRIAVEPKDIHVLVSRCLQCSECRCSITGNIENCRECGRCKIGAIKRLCKSQKLSVTVESGGTSARRRLKEMVPKLVIAVACERELAAGILDTSLPVVGVILIPGLQPCSDSDVKITELEERLRSAVKEV